MNVVRQVTNKRRPQRRKCPFRVRLISAVPIKKTRYCIVPIVPVCAQEKTYYIYEEDGEPMLHRAEGTKIDWAAGKNPTVKARSLLPPAPHADDCRFVPYFLESIPQTQGLLEGPRGILFLLKGIACLRCLGLADGDRCLIYCRWNPFLESHPVHEVSHCRMDSLLPSTPACFLRESLAVSFWAGSQWPR